MTTISTDLFLTDKPKSELEEKLEQSFTSPGYGSYLSNIKKKFNSPDSQKDHYSDIYQNFTQNFKHFEEILKGETNTCFTCNIVDSIKSINGIHVCTICGVEKAQDSSQGIECQHAGKALGDNNTTARSGLKNNLLLPQSNFSTKIVGSKTSYSLKKINNIWNSISYKERTLLKIFKKISNSCKQNGIPKNVIEYSQVLYCKAYEKQRSSKKGNKGSRQDKLEGLISGCIYYSCKAYNVNRSHQEISNICGIDKSSVSYGCKLVFKLLHTEIDFNTNHTNYADFIERYACHLQMEDYEIKIVEELCENIYDQQLMENSKPSTVAAVAIDTCSMLYDFGIERRKISKICNITESTLAKNYRFLIECIDSIIV